MISAGTGLGEAGMYWDGLSHHVFACEGGHSDFAPRDDISKWICFATSTSSTDMSAMSVLFPAPAW